MDSLCETYISMKDPTNYSNNSIVCLIDNVVVGNITPIGFVSGMMKSFFPKWETFTEILKNKNHTFIFHETSIVIGTLWDGEKFVAPIEEENVYLKGNKSIVCKKVKNSFIYYNLSGEPVKDYNMYIINLLEEYLNFNNQPLNILINIDETLNLNENKTLKIGINYAQTILSDEASLTEGKLAFNEKNYTVNLEMYDFLNKMDKIIDYSRPNIKNIELYENFNDYSKKVYYITPSIYNVIYSEKPKSDDILTLFIEKVNPRRQFITDQLNVHAVNDVFGEDLKQLLINTKILINIHRSDYEHTFEEIRCLPALMCKCLVVSEISPLTETILYSNLVIWTTYDNLVSKTKEVLENYNEYYTKIFTPENIGLLNRLHAQNGVIINKIMENNNVIELSIPENAEQ